MLKNNTALLSIIVLMGSLFHYQNQMFTQMIIFAQPLLKMIIIHLLEKQYIIMIMIFQVDIKF